MGEPAQDHEQAHAPYEAPTQHHARAGHEPTSEAAAPERASEPLIAAGGNRALGNALARMGAGLLPGGAVHPDVASAIGAARGGGQPLQESVRANVGEQLGDSLDDVRIHTDARADELARSVAARAFTTGTDVFFAAGEYQPASREGVGLLAHELTHVIQQRGAPTGGPMTITDPGDAVETEAEEVARDVSG